MLNVFCVHDLSDEESNYCGVYGYVTSCPFPCQYCEGKEKDDGADRPEKPAE